MASGQTLEVFLKIIGAKKAQEELKKTGDSTKALKTGLLEIGGKAATGIAGALVGALSGAAVAGLSMNRQMENVSAQLNAFTKDGEQSAAILEMIRDRAAKTPFAFNEMASAAAGLLPASKASGEGLESLISKAEILAASNPAQGLEGAAFALREAVSGDYASLIERFNLPRSYINQLKAEGVPALEIVGRAMRQVGYDADLVSNLAETADGRWSTFLDTLQGLAATTTQPIFDSMSEGLGEINSWLVANEPMLQSFANTMATDISEGVSAWKGIAADAGLLSSAISDAAAVNPVLSSIGSAAATAGDAIRSGFSWALEEAQDQTAQFIIGQIKMTGMGDEIAASMQATNAAMVTQAEVSARDAAMLKMFAASSERAAAAQSELAAAQVQAGLAGATSRYAAQASMYGAETVHRNAIETQQYITDTTQSLEEFKRQSEASAESAASSWQSAFDERKSAISGAVESVLGAGFGAIGDLGLNLGGEDAGRAIAEDARRLGAIAAGDFGGEAARLLEASNPELFKKVMASENPAEVARGILSDFQMGIDQYGLIDREAAKERIRKMLFAGEQRQAIINELTQELMAEGQYSAGQIQQAIGVAIGGAGETITGAVPEEQQALITGIKTEIDNIGISADGTGVKVAEAFTQTTDPILTLQTGLTEVVKILERVDVLAQAATGSVTGLGSSVGLPAGTPATGPGFASGGSFVVPPGYPNDSYPMRVSSGERVTVSTGGQSAQSVTVPVYLDGQVIAQVVSRVQGTQLNNSNRLGNAARL